ncbi:MAG: hypothetical protein PWP22_1578 [Thermoanaerobacter sp.]|nr:hypothetical protein [Thermoanaerobacter sp.]
MEEIIDSIIKQLINIVKNGGEEEYLEYYDGNKKYKIRVTHDFFEIIKADEKVRIDWLGIGALDLDGALDIDVSLLEKLFFNIVRNMNFLE